MTLSNIAELVEELGARQLLTPEQLAQVQRDEADFASPRALCRELVQRGWLTDYQATLLLQRRGEELVCGPFRVLAPLGEGGISQVFKAWHSRQNRLVALKVIRPEMLGNREAVGRFRREMQALAQSAHPNIVKAIDIDPGDESPFFAMELIDGIDLGKLVGQEGPLPVVEACEYVRQTACGLQHAHEIGLVHRDIKPANLLVAGRTADCLGTVKVLDLGLARLRQSATPPLIANDLTRIGALLGTPDYLAPEQARNARAADIRSDIYSLGCTFYFLLFAQPPFPGGNLMHKLFQHQQAEPALDRRGDLPPGVVAVLRRMLAKKPEERYPVPVAVADALAPFCPAGRPT